MNGEPLPFEHGFPVRMVVPGLYGYVSATKWIVDFEVTRFSDFSAYWTDRGWSVEAPIKTSSRIDVPEGLRDRQGRTGGRGRGRLGAAPRHQPRSRSRSTTARGSRPQLAAEDSDRHLAAVDLPRGTPRPAPTSSRSAPPTRPATADRSPGTAAPERLHRPAQHGRHGHESTHPARDAVPKYFHQQPPARKGTKSCASTSTPRRYRSQRAGLRTDRIRLWRWRRQQQRRRRYDDQHEQQRTGHEHHAVDGRAPPADWSARAAPTTRRPTRPAPARSTVWPPRRWPPPRRATRC